VAILVENHRIFPLPEYFSPLPRRRGSLEIGYQRWRWNMRMMGMDGQQTVDNSIDRAYM